MGDHPLKKGGTVHFSICDCPKSTGQFLLGVRELDAIERQEDQHYVSAGSLVPILKGVIRGDSKSQLGCFCLEG